jgi:protein-tyrosine phosphatase
MEFQTTCNDNHDDRCTLWTERTFWDGDDMWDGEAEMLRTAPLGMNPRTGVEFPYNDRGQAISVNAPHTGTVYELDNKGELVKVGPTPWEAADEYIWNGDEPIMTKAYAATRATQLGLTPPDSDEDDDWGICDQEDEVNAALVSGVEPDEYGWVKLPDGSWADQENRVTYRRIKDDQDQECWVEELWDEVDLGDDPDNQTDARCSCNPEKTYWCTPCGVTRDMKDEPWRWCTNQDWKDYDNGWDYWTNTCTHALDPIQLKDVVVYASKNRRHTPDTTPDLGVYAYSGWNPDSAAIFIPWTDFGLPTIPFTSAARMLKQAFDAAKAGQVVEFGCMGGHGRTGTMLACMAILADPTMTGPEAVKYVQKVHCAKAVETSSQEWFVRWFRAWYLGEPFTEMQPSGYSSGTSGGTRTLVSTTVEENKTVKRYSDGTSVTVWNQGAYTYEGGTTGTMLPKGGSATTTPSGNWCSGCHRAVFTYHNTDCPFDFAETTYGSVVGELDKPFQFDHNRPDGNVAPGATANARRKAERRKLRQASAKRAKQKRSEEYRNRAQSGRK